MRLIHCLALSLATCAIGAAQAQSPAVSSEALRLIVEKALQGSPEVASRLDAYRAAADGVDVSVGALRPRLDVDANAGISRDRITSRQPGSETMRRTGLGLTVTQLLWDGLGTRREIDRMSHDRLARYFDLLENTELTALEAARAHFDVLRFQRLVALAEDNYVQHRYASKQIESRFSAGVGRGVDLEQSNARLALAESNLNTETANLHDVMARYLRIVGEAPSTSPLPLTLLKAGVPASSTEALDIAVRQSPAVSASIESVRSARALVSVREAAYQPKVEARVRSGFGNNYEAVRDQRNDSVAEIVLNWNLYNGGSDRARVRQQANLLNQAEDLRDKACRDVRQTIAIAYNDIRKLNDQIVLLDRNTLAIEKTRNAYRQQFDIGQRSLLDLLNSENELYTARRAYANAEYDLALAYARTHAGLSQLTVQLGIARPPALEDDDKDWAPGKDAPAARCPTIAITPPAVDIDALVRRVPSVPQKPAN